jgi:hypothetical protein
MTGESGSAGEPGPIGEEAARLLSAAQDWFHRTLGDPSTARIAVGSAECAWCPLCQLITVLRGERPDISDKFAETQTAVAGLLRALADAATSMTPHDDGRTEANRVHKIDLRDGE